MHLSMIRICLTERRLHCALQPRAYRILAMSQNGDLSRLVCQAWEMQLGSNELVQFTASSASRSVLSTHLSASGLL